MSRAASWSSSPASGLCLRPPLDLGTQPQFHAAVTEVHNRTRHVVVPALVEADAVPVRQAEDVGDDLGVD